MAIHYKQLAKLATKLTQYKISNAAILEYIMSFFKKKKILYFSTNPRFMTRRFQIYGMAKFNVTYVINEQCLIAF